MSESILKALEHTPTEHMAKHAHVSFLERPEPNAEKFQMVTRPLPLIVLTHTALTRDRAGLARILRRPPGVR